MTDTGHTHTYDPPQIEAREPVDRPLVGLTSPVGTPSATFTHI